MSVSFLEFIVGGLELIDVSHVGDVGGGAHVDDEVEEVGEDEELDDGEDDDFYYEEEDEEGD